jgi:hypothetical protein
MSKRKLSQNFDISRNANKNDPTVLKRPRSDVIIRITLTTVKYEMPEQDRL